MKSTRLLSCVVGLLVLLCAAPVHAQSATTQPGAAPAASRAPQNTVVWISLDGLRHDYADRFNPPYLRQLIATGAFSKKLVPVFPSITFPNHSSQATGVTCDLHGITDNQFHDSKNDQNYTFPNPQEILLSEPIWTAAQRQGVRTAVEDWPMSYAQKGPHASAYFGETFDRGLSDEQRVTKLITHWTGDRDAATLRLLIGYIPSIDSAGHSHGPEAPATGNILLAVDRVIKKFHERAIEQFKRTAQPGDSLYLILSTDHGMALVTHLVNLKLLLQDVPTEGVNAISSGPLLNIHLDKIADANQRAARAQTLVDSLKKREFVSAVYTRENLPAAWGYAHPTRTGDVVAMLKSGYKFDQRAKSLVDPATDAKGAHGYPAEDCPDMAGLLIIHRFPEPLGGKDLGEVGNLQLHPTAARLLGIAPAPGAKADPIELK